MGIKIEVHSVDDWEALYVDGKLQGQNHSDQLEGFLLNHFHYDKGPLTIDTLKHEYHEDDPIATHVLNSGRFPEELSAFGDILLEAKREELEQKAAKLEEVQRELDALKAEIVAYAETK